MKIFLYDGEKLEEGLLSFAISENCVFEFVFPSHNEGVAEVNFTLIGPGGDSGELVEWVDNCITGRKIRLNLNQRYSRLRFHLEVRKHDKVASKGKEDTPGICGHGLPRNLGLLCFKVSVSFQGKVLDILDEVVDCSSSNYPPPPPPPPPLRIIREGVSIGNSVI